MAAKGTIGGKIVLEGESQYRAALKNIKTEQAELRSEMKLCQATFKDSQNSLEALEKKYEILNKQIDTQNKKVEVYQKAMEASTKKERDAAKKIEELRVALQEAQRAMKEMSGSSDTTSESMENQKKAVAELEKKLSLAEKGYDKAVQKTKSYQTSINYTRAELQGMEAELANTEKHMQEARNSTDKCASSIDEYGKEIKEASENTAVFGDVLKANLVSSVIQEGVKKLVEGIKDIADFAVDSGSSFEASMSQVAATMGMTADEVENGSEAYTLLSNTAKECGKTTMFSASQAGEALNYLALAGYDAKKSAETLPKVLDLAAAGGLDLAYASDLVTDSMAALGMEASRLDNYIDQMAKTSQKSNTSVAQLGEATLVCAGTVSLTGQSIETMNTELGILANNGMKGAEGGTHLRNILLSLSAPTDKAAMAIENLGLEIADNQGNMRDLNDIMIDLNSSLAGMSDVEKTQVINKIFNKTDISAVNALLKGTGDEYNNLFNEINNCSGAAANMAETLNNNLKGKVTILNSALEGLGISIYEIFDDNMKESVDGATEAVGRLQRSVESGDMRVSLNRLSDSLGNFCEDALEVGEDALPVMIDGLSWLIDHGDVIVSAIAGITAANAANKLETKYIAPVIEMATKSWNAYKISTDSATASQWLLDAAMNANPAGILITAVTALTAAVAAYCIINKNNLETVNEVTEATKKQVEATEDLLAGYAESTEKRRLEREELEKEAITCGNLVDELGKLQSKTNLTREEQTRQKMIVEQLNQIIPELNLAIDENTGKTNKSAQAIRKNVDAMMAMNKAAAAQEDLAEIAKNQYEAEKELVALKEQYADQLKEVAEAEKALNEVVGDNIDSYSTVGAVESRRVVEAKAGLKELEESMSATQEQIDAFGEEYAKTQEYIENTESLAAAAEATEGLGEAAESTGSRISTMSEDVAAAYDMMYEDLSETIAGQMSLFDEFDEKTAISKEKLLENMESQIIGIRDWADNMEKLGETAIDQGLLQHLASLGPEGAAYVAAFVDMTEDDIEKANELFEQSLTIPDETVEKVAEAYVKAGENAAEGYTSGIEGGSEKAAEASAKLGEDSLNTLEEKLEENSPSKATKRMGEYFDEGFIQGVKGEQPKVIDTITNIVSEILWTSENGIQTSTYREIGARIPEGIAQGIRSGKNSVINAAKELCSAALDTFQKEFSIKDLVSYGGVSTEGFLEDWKRTVENHNAIIAESFPETSIRPMQKGGLYGDRGLSRKAEMGDIEYNISQEFNIYGDVNDLISLSRKMKQTQKEAAEEW